MNRKPLSCQPNIPPPVLCPNLCPVVLIHKNPWFMVMFGIRIDDPKRFVPDLPLSEMPGRIPVLLSIFRVDPSREGFESRDRHDNEIASVESIPFKAAALKVLRGEIYLSSPMAIVARLLLKHCLGSNSNGKWI